MSKVARELQPASLWVLAAAAIASLASLLAPDTSVADALQGLALILLLIAGTLAWRGFREAGDAIASLQRSEALQSAIIDRAGEAIVVIDDQAVILSFNRAAERMFGYSAEEMIGTSLERLMTEGGRRAHAAYLAAHGVTAMVEAARLRTVHKGVRKRGDTFPFELHMTEWADADGRRLFTGIMRDVTDHEHAADVLRESQARFVALFEQSQQPLFIFALSGGGEFVLETMNEAAEARAGLSRFAAEGRTLEELVGPNARELKRALLDCLSSAAPVSDIVGAAGEEWPLPLPLTLAPMRSASGEIRAVLAAGPAATPNGSP